MAERRMFSKKIIDSDAFLDMPQSSQLLYFHLSMRADDDGFVNQPKTIMRICGAKDDDLTLLVAKKFIIPFENGVVVIKHWRIHNYIRNDRYKETTYKDLKDSLYLDENGAYTQNNSLVYQMDTNGRQMVSTGKDSIGKDNNTNINILGESTSDSKKIPPSLDDVKAYCEENNLEVDPVMFWSFYESKGWMIGKNKMKDWHKALGTWERNNGGKTSFTGFAHKVVKETVYEEPKDTSLNKQEQKEAEELAKKLLGR